MNTNCRRMTPQRTEILAEIRAAHDHPTAAELHDRLRERLPRLSLGTVYRNLEVLESEGLVAKLPVGGAEARYDGMPEPHDHARCRCCGAVADVPSRSFSGPPALPDGFLVEDRRLEYVGVCAACRPKTETAPAAVSP